MKRAIVSFFFLGFVGLLKCQLVFCPKGAEWNYLFLGFNLCHNCWSENEKVVYTRDSVLVADTVKVLLHTRYYNQFNFSTGSALTLLRQAGDTIFFRNLKTAHSWQVLYNFNVPLNGFWPVTYATFTYSNVVIAKKDTSINGIQLKKLKVQIRGPGYTQGSWADTVNIVERLGSDRFLFSFRGREISDGDVFMQPLCYKDDSLGVAQYSSYPCDYENPAGLTEQVLTDGYYGVFPNPSSVVFNFRGIEIDSVLSVFSFLGEDFSSRVRVLSAAEIDVNDLPAGIYVARVRSKNSTTFSETLIKR